MSVAAAGLHLLKRINLFSLATPTCFESFFCSECLVNVFEFNSITCRGNSTSVPLHPKWFPYRQLVMDEFSDFFNYVASDVIIWHIRSGKVWMNALR